MITWLQTLKKLTARLGHASPRAAMIYQHATQDRDQVIAQAVGGGLVRAARANRQPPSAGEADNA